MCRSFLIQLMFFAAILTDRSSASAQDGQLDDWFNTLDNGDHGEGFAYLHTFYQWNAPVVRDMVAAPDGNILVVGLFTLYNGRTISGVVKIDPNGKLVDDLTPSDGPVDDSASGIAAWPDGSMVIVGEFQAIGTTLRNKIARLHADGSLDMEFDPGIGVNGFLSKAAVGPDGKVLITGGFTEVSGAPYGRISRLLPDGSPDPDFASSIGTDGPISALKILPDGKILIAGNFNSYNGIPRAKIARLLPDGSLDPDFDPGAGANETIRALDVNPDGSIWISGLFTSYGNATVYRFARLLPDGELHPEFIPVPVTSGANTVVKTDGTGHVFMGGIGSYDGESMTLARIAPDGSRDTSFAPSPQPCDQGIRALLPLPYGRLLIGGGFFRCEQKPRAAIACLLPNGALDHSFNPSRGPNAQVNCLAEYAQDRSLVGGKFTHYNDIPTGALIRLNSNGTIDPTFNADMGLADLKALHVLPDGKILVGGASIQIGGVLQKRLVRLLPDGALDPSFNVGSGPSYTVHVILVDEQGMIYIGGDFNHVDGVPRSRLARLFPDGALDNTFVPDQSDDPVFTMCFNPDERVMVRCAGRFVRLNNDGSEDGSYTATMIHGHINTSLCLDDGSVILGGHINAIDLVPFGKYMVKLDPMGAPDPTYMTGSGPDSWVVTLALLDDGKVMAGGSFKNVDDLPYAGLARLNSDGSLDQTFGSTPGIHHVVWPTVNAILPLPQEKLLVGGKFASYNGQVKSHLARIMGSIGIGVHEFPDRDPLKIHPNPTKDICYVEIEGSTEAEILIYDGMGRRLMKKRNSAATGLLQLDLEHLSPGIYFIEVRNKKGEMITGRVMKL